MVAEPSIRAAAETELSYPERVAFFAATAKHFLACTNVLKRENSDFICREIGSVEYPVATTSCERLLSNQFSKIPKVQKSNPDNKPA